MYFPSPEPPKPRPVSTTQQLSQQLSRDMLRRKDQKTLDSFFFRSRGSTGGDGEAARSPPGQAESIASEPTEPRLDDEPELVSTDVSASDVSASEQPAASRDGKHQSSGFNPKWLGDPKFSGWLYKTEYGKHVLYY